MAVHNVQQKVLWSYSSLAREFDLDRRTVKDRIIAAGIKPFELRKGNPVFQIKDAAPALFLDSPIYQDGKYDPEKLPPDMLLKHYQAKSEALKLAAKEFEVITADDYAADLALNYKSLVQLLDTLPDVLTRDCDLSSEQFDKVQEICDEKRSELYEELVSD